MRKEVTFEEIEDMLSETLDVNFTFNDMSKHVYGREFDFDDYVLATYEIKWFDDGWYDILGYERYLINAFNEIMGVMEKYFDVIITGNTIDELYHELQYYDLDGIVLSKKEYEARVMEEEQDRFENERMWGKDDYYDSYEDR